MAKNKLILRKSAGARTTTFKPSKQCMRSFGATVFSNIGQSLGYLSLQLHWSTLVTPIVLGLRGTYRAYSTCMKEVRAVDKKIRECCERLGIPYNH